MSADIDLLRTSASIGGTLQVVFRNEGHSPEHRGRGKHDLIHCKSWMRGGLPRTSTEIILAKQLNSCNKIRPRRLVDVHNSLAEQVNIVRNVHCFITVTVTATATGEGERVPHVLEAAADRNTAQRAQIYSTSTRSSTSHRSTDRFRIRNEAKTRCPQANRTVILILFTMFNKLLTVIIGFVI